MKPEGILGVYTCHNETRSDSMREDLKELTCYLGTTLGVSKPYKTSKKNS